LSPDHGQILPHISETKQQQASCFVFYSMRCRHSWLGGRKPNMTYFRNQPKKAASWMRIRLSIAPLALRLKGAGGGAVDNRSQRGLQLRNSKTCSNKPGRL
jgi:hypothetical protein